MTSNLSTQDIDQIVEGRHHDPFAVLGPHGGTIRVFVPGALSLMIKDWQGQDTLFTQIDERGLFEARYDLAEGHHLLEADFGSSRCSFYDPYSFQGFWGDVDSHLFSEGTHHALYQRLGAHPDVIDEIRGVRFALWAPNAKTAAVIGDFNQWDGRRHVMRKRIECGVFEIFIPGLEKGELYQFELKDEHGRRLPNKSDPFATRAQHPPEQASVVHGIPAISWQDEQWTASRANRQHHAAPVSIYEVHLGSWARIAGDNNRYLSYLELADRLVPYVRDLGFTHIELMPVSEYPFDGSWGYQPTGLFAPTIRYGTAEEFAQFVNICHINNIGVILDWVPGHFPTDSHGLARFDGTALFEHEDPRQGFHQDWNTAIYNYGRREVSNILLANALYWFDVFHIDAIRVDAVASMLYLDYSRKEGEWIPNEHGGRENIEAINFLKKLNELTFAANQGYTSFAEESTAWPGVSRPLYTGGLGFGFKWNMGWMHDTLEYMKKDPVHRKYHHNHLTFGLLYGFSENFVLPLSHDEVVHGKGSLLSRMPGDYWQQFANLRVYYTLMWTHPGKKLLFMGGEFAQASEWNYAHSLDWHLLNQPANKGIFNLIKNLNSLYCTQSAFFEQDCESEGFRWIDGGNAEQSVLSYLRYAKDGSFVVCIFNFTPVVRHDFRLGVPMHGSYKELLNSDAEEFGGSGVINREWMVSAEQSWNGYAHSISLTLPPLGGVVLIKDS